LHHFLLMKAAMKTTLLKTILSKTILTAAFSLLLFPGFGAAAQTQASSIDAPAGTTLLLTAKGDGVQIYACTEGHWTLKAPDAKLLDAQGKVIGKHFAGPTWQLINGGEVKGKAIANQPAPDGSSVPWLLVGGFKQRNPGQCRLHSPHRDTRRRSAERSLHHRRTARALHRYLRVLYGQVARCEARREIAGQTCA
jgi:hypothetical protein